MSAAVKGSQLGEPNWEDIPRVVASIYTGAVRAYDVVTMLQRDGHPTALGEAIAMYGRIFKSLHILSYTAWGDIPTWIEALATIGLLIGAVITARYAIKAFGKQTEQLEDQRTLNSGGRPSRGAAKVSPEGAIG